MFIRHNTRLNCCEIVYNILEHDLILATGLSYRQAKNFLRHHQKDIVL